MKTTKQIISVILTLILLFSGITVIYAEEVAIYITELFENTDVSIEESSTNQELIPLASERCVNNNHVWRGNGSTSGKSCSYCGKIGLYNQICSECPATQQVCKSCGKVQGK